MVFYELVLVDLGDLDRAHVEGALEAVLAERGEITGAGTGRGRSHLDLELEPATEAAAVASVAVALVDLGLGGSAWLRREGSDEPVLAVELAS